MREFFDAVADAHFISQDDGTVRFALPKPNAGYLVLDESQAEGAKILWRSLVRYYVYAGHACAPLSLIVPWLGLLLLPTLWFVAYCLIQEIRNQYNPEVGVEESQLEWVDYRLSQLISRRFAVWLKWTLTAAIASYPLFYFVLFPELAFGFGWGAVTCLLVLAYRWSAFCSRLLNNPMAKEHWAQSARK